MSGSVQPWELFVEQAKNDCAGLAQGIACLIGESRGRQALPELGDLAGALAVQAEQQDMPSSAQLASAIEHCCALLFDGQVDPAQALPLLASGIETLANTLRLALAPVESQGAITPLLAATYELETLLPAPGAEPAHNKSGPDVSIERLRSRNKPSPNKPRS